MLLIDHALLQQCAPKVAPVTMMAIIKTESHGNPLALNLNKGKRLLYQAKNPLQAKAWAEYLEHHGYNFDIGLAQVNIKNAHKYGYSASQLLDPCNNLRVASDILLKNYNQAISGSFSQQEALYKAISAYNTGNYHSGFNNGYVTKVVFNATGTKNKKHIVTYNSSKVAKNIQHRGKVQLNNIKLAQKD